MAHLRLPSLNIKSRLTLLLGLIGLIPVAIAATALTNRASTEIGSMGAAFGDSMSSQVLEQLDVVRDSKKDAVEMYFATIEGQIRTLADDEMVIDAMLGFKNHFATYRDLHATTADSVNTLYDGLLWQ